MFKNASKKTIIFIIVIMVSLIGVFSLKSYNKSKKYKSIVTIANEYMENKDYDKAMEKFKESLEYKEEQKVKEKIEECKGELINLSNEALKNKEYEKVDNYLNVLLKHNEKNEEVIKIKNTIKEERKKDKEEEIQRYKEEERKKQYEKEKNNKVTKEEAENLVQPLKNKDEKISYLGIKQVPEIPKESVPYRKFPKEIENKEVYAFDILVVYSNSNKATVGRYYVDFSGNIYKDTYPSNLECVKVK